MEFEVFTISLYTGPGPIGPPRVPPPPRNGESCSISSVAHVRQVALGSEC